MHSRSYTTQQQKWSQLLWEPKRKYQQNRSWEKTGQMQSWAGTFLKSVELKYLIKSYRWRSSIWKLLWKDLLIYTLLFLVIGIVYRFALPEQYQIHLESLIKYCHTQNAGEKNMKNQNIKMPWLRTSSYLPAWFLCLTGCEQVVESVLLSAMAWHYRYLPESCQGEGGWGGGSKNHQKNYHKILPAGLSTLC